MALLKLDATEKYIERNAIVLAKQKSATQTEVEIMLGTKFTMTTTYAAVKAAMDNPAFIPIWSAVVELPGLANQAIDPRQVAAVVEKNANDCFLYMQDGRRITIAGETAADTAAALGYVA